MSLDFAVLGSNGAPERTVSLNVNLHHELVTAASACKLTRFADFADYYEDVEVAADDLGDLAGQAQALHAKASSAELQRFLGDLTDLIAYAVANKKSLHVIAD